MADKPLDLLYFPIFADYKGTGRTLESALGTFSCRRNVATFLDIEDKAVSGVIVKERKGGERSLQLVGSTTLEPSEGETGIADSKITLPIGGKGSRTVIIQTGVPISDSKRKIGAKKAKHTISFRFPGFCTIAIISEALGELIPTTKIKNPPGASDIEGYFKVKGGRTYPIMAQSAAQERKEGDVLINVQEILALGTKAKIVEALQAAGNS